MSAEPKIVVRGLSRNFARKDGELAVLQGIDLAVQPGEFVCILGPSGCGKSTLLNIIAGFDRPSSGTVDIDGQAVSKPDARRVLVFQEYGVFPWATVHDNIALGLHALPKDEIQRIVQRQIELIGLRGFENAYPAELSGGMRQRVAVARALAVSPDVIFMDEPLGALDSLTRLSMRAELHRIWAKERMTVLFVTHDVDESIQLADRVVVLSPRPARILEVMPITLRHPRDFQSVEYARLKTRLYELLGVDAAI